MPKNNRKRSRYVLTIPDNRLEAWIDLAKEKDEPLEALILEALDRYIEKESCQQEKQN
jgi:hypothetical protein